MQFDGLLTEVYCPPEPSDDYIAEIVAEAIGVGYDKVRIIDHAEPVFVEHEMEGPLYLMAHVYYELSS